jgi:hypothetical protein
MPGGISAPAAATRDCIRNDLIFIRFRAPDAMYGNRLDRVVLFGSRARGEAAAIPVAMSPHSSTTCLIDGLKWSALRAVVPTSLMQTHSWMGSSIRRPLISNARRRCPRSGTKVSNSDADPDTILDKAQVAEAEVLLEMKAVRGQGCYAD